MTNSMVEHENIPNESLDQEKNFKNRVKQQQKNNSLNLTKKRMNIEVFWRMWF